MKETVMQLVRRDVCRLFSVSETLNKNGEYSVKAFDKDAFNGEINVSDLDKTLFELAKATYGRGSCWYEVNPLSDIGDCGEIKIDFEDATRLVVPNIIDDISSEVDCNRFFILVDKTFTACSWVVCEPTVGVYSG